MSPVLYKLTHKGYVCAMVMGVTRCYRNHWDTVSLGEQHLCPDAYPALVPGIYKNRVRGEYLKKISSECRPYIAQIVLPVSRV